MKSEKEKFLAGEEYAPADAELQRLHRRALDLLARYNPTLATDTPDENPLLRELLPNAHGSLRIQAPFLCDFGSMIYGGERSFINFNCTMLDTAPIRLGRRVLVGPNVQFYAPVHPRDYRLRAAGTEHGEGIEVGDDCWIGGGAIICPGVRIGSRCIIGAGSVVVRDIPDDSLAAGNPATVRRKLG